LPLHTSEFILEGNLATYQMRDLILGFETPIADKINRGDILKGNLYVSPTVTPLLNNQKGPMTENYWTVDTGEDISINQGHTGQISQINGMN
jgi:hypothetical protein